MHFFSVISLYSSIIRFLELDFSRIEEKVHFCFDMKRLARYYESMSSEKAPLDDFEEEPHFESVESNTIESLSGPFPERLRLCFGTKELEVFVQEVFVQNGLSIKEIQLIPEERVSEIIALAADYFGLSSIEQNLRAKQITSVFRSIVRLHAEAE